MLRRLSLCPILLLLAACSTALPLPVIESTATPASISLTTTPENTVETVPPRVLSVCLGQEPASLFIYGDASAAAQRVRQAIYDGPMDLRAFALHPVILERLPSLGNGDVTLETVEVISNTLIADASGNLVNLKEGVDFLPAGCNDMACAQTYSGSGRVKLEQLTVRFRLRPGLLWSDGQPLQATDSVYSFEVAKSLYPRVRPELIPYTAAYQALDALTLEWRGVPGYKDALYPTFFFWPLPQHQLSSLSPQDLLTTEISTRSPLGWGPYIVEEWTAGDHITLRKNPNYFRLTEGLPRFDHLVYRFVGDGEQALSAFLAGECDVVDETALSALSRQRLLQLEEQARMRLVRNLGAAWEHLDFGLLPADTARPNLFQVREVRQALAMCLDRQTIAKQLFGEESQTLDTYVPSVHPLYAATARHYKFDPEAASALLEQMGWKDLDKDPATPRLAQGVPGVADGTPFEFTYLVPASGDREQAAQLVQAFLAQCGVKANLRFEEPVQLFAPGPEGPLFGRQFEMAQFAWPTALQPPCWLYTTDEIPGPYPDFPKGWGGANATGYSNPQFDQACRRARFSLPDTPEYDQAHRQAQEIFAEDLPAIPLYLHLNLTAVRKDMCGVEFQALSATPLWNLEAWDYGETCLEK